MTDAKHTPGPWCADDGEGGEWAVGSEANGGIVAILYGKDIDHPEDAKANALLIACAPETLSEFDALGDRVSGLLAALESLEDKDFPHNRSAEECGGVCWVCREVKYLTRALSDARTAIAKATGANNG